MEYYFVYKILIVTLISEEITSYTIRQKRSNQKFNVLVNLYKMSPLRNSKVFRTFSNTVLLPNRGDRPDMNLDSNESVKRKENDTIIELKRIEEKIHVTKSPRIVLIPQPDYKLPNDQIEEFVKPAYSFNDMMKVYQDKDNQQAMLYQISGKKEKVTKMLPIDKIPLYVDDSLMVLPNDEKTDTPLTTSMKCGMLDIDELMVNPNDCDSYFPDIGVIVI